MNDFLQRTLTISRYLRIDKLFDASATSDKIVS